VWFRLRLLCCFGFACVRPGKLAAEALDAACGVDQLLLAGEVGVAGGADFDDDVAFVRGAGLKAGSARALDVDGFVLWVNSLFRHDDDPFPELDLPAGRGSLATDGNTSHRCACRATVYAPGTEALRQYLKFI